MAKKYMTKEQIEDYEYLCHERTYGRLLTGDSLKMLCQSYDYDPEKIGKHFLELLPKICEDYG